VYSTLSRRAFAGLLWLLCVEYYAFRLNAGQKTDEKDVKETTEDKKKAAADKVYEPGGDVRAPKLVHYVEPEFSSSSKEAFVDGTVKISAVVSGDGLPTNLHVESGLNSEEDKTAVEAVKQWRFKPGTKAGEPVRVKVMVEVNFHLM
jgi:TonB family protein